MPDYYHGPALILTALLLPAFGYLYYRFRDIRTMLWFLGFFFALLRMLLLYRFGWWDLTGPGHPWLEALGQTSIQISAALFLGSLSPLHFRLGRFNVLYVIPYAFPIVVYAILFHGVFGGQLPSGFFFWIFPALIVLALIVAVRWGMARGSMPPWVGVPICLVMGCLNLWVYFGLGGRWPLSFVESISHFMTALLLFFVYRRFSPGVLLSALGFSAWSLMILKIFPIFSSSTDLNINRIIIMGKVVAAIGLIMLALEDELAINKASGERERRARLELEAYTNLILSRRRVEDFDRQGDEICHTIVDHSRFAQAALLLPASGRLRLAGCAGFDSAIALALGEAAARISLDAFPTVDSHPPAVARSHTVQLDLLPWLTPGDDLKRLRFTTALAVPMVGRAGTEGALLLGAMRNRSNHSSSLHHPGSQLDTLRADDLLPIEMLIARLHASRSQTIMLEKLIDAEKFAGLGQLAGNVTQQLNNPLTVILGYASLLDESAAPGSAERKAVDSILTEARRMRTTLESLARVARPQTNLLATVSVAEMLADLEQLQRPEFLNRSIDFRFSVAPALPRVLCHPQQLRQAILHCLQFAMEATEHPASPYLHQKPKQVRLEATSEGNRVQVLIAHSGLAFAHPDRAFEAFVPNQHTAQTSSLGLNLCASILRDHNGRASAVNLEPSGAAILLELQAA
jgi:signal transduction histidine kinase